jgi:hypothetical protein
MLDDAAVVDSPIVDTPGADDGGALDSTVPDSEQDTPITDQPPAEPSLEGEETPVEGEGDTPPDPNAPPAKQPTPQELKSDETLKKMYRENYGQIKEIIKQNPALRPAFFKAAELNEIFVTPDDARQAKEWATQLYKFDNMYYGNESNKREFINSLYENSKEADGSSPHFDQVASMFVGDGLSNIAARVQQGDPNIARAFSDLGLNGKQAMVAVQAVAAMFGIPLRGVNFPKPTAAGPNAGPGTMSEREQFLANRVAELDAQLKSGQQTTLAQAEQNFYNGIQSTFHGSLDTDIAKRLENATALKSQKPGFQNWVRESIKQRTIDAVRNDSFFANQMEAMSRSGNRGPEHQRQLVAALEQRARQFLPDALKEVLGEAGITLVQKTNAARTQAGTPGREPATSGTPGRLSKPGERQSPKPSSGETYEQFSRRTLGIE